ncbi:uncharacterized protein LOC132747287 isoform X2 [Ruditapes philippinarum]|uniref:uncharacterized protein LOC132747287 isoform X2 n=1 Tax=Ruditapes philippinarum TaxID=129788 RepID=UPI00295B697A|nr:uncharacterized protein LOC132747287 isoform X2 [Ruditapes philippinarum]
MMEKCLSCVILGILCSLSAADECKPNKDITFVSCPTNCSQSPPRVSGDEVFFNCSIGVKKDVENYKEDNKIQFLPESSIFDAPTIHGVKTYWKYFQNYSPERSLILDFSLPKGVINPKNKNDWRLPKAVFLTFEGLASSQADQIDEFYTKCPRERIFQFHNYATDNYYDMTTPAKSTIPFKLVRQRRIEFDCLIGLTGVDYAITLQTAEGKTAKYLTAVTAWSESKWSPAIMTFLNETSHSLYTVVEKPPLGNINGYKVNLVKAGYGVIQSGKYIEWKKGNSTIFTNLTRGQYIVEVTPVCNQTCGPGENLTVKSVVIDGSMLPWTDKDSLEPMKVVAMIAGCIMGVTLLLSITYCIRKRPKCQESSTVPKASGLLLHPFRDDCTTGENDVVLKLERYVNEAFECTVVNSANVLREHSSNIDNLQNGVDKILKDSSFVLVLCSKNCYKPDAIDLVNEFYSCVLKAAIERRNVHNDVRVIVVDLTFNSYHDISTLLSSINVLSANIPVINFINKPDKVYCKIHGLERCPPNRNIPVENTSQWSNTWTELKRVVNQVRNNSDIGQNELKPLLSRDNNFTGKPCKIEPALRLSPPIGSDIDNPFLMLQKINAEAEKESMLGEEFELDYRRSGEAKSDSHKQFMSHKKVAEQNGNERYTNRTNDQRLRQQSHRKQQPRTKVERVQNRPHIQEFQAEVHNSTPLETSPDVIVHHNEQPISLPPNFAHHFPTRCGREEKQEMNKRPENHQCLLQTEKHSKLPDVHQRVLAFHADESDSDSLSDDSLRRNKADFYSSSHPHVFDKHIPPPTLHGNLNHHQHHPDQFQNRVTHHRYPVHSKIGFYESHLPGQQSMCNQGAYYDQRHVTDHRFPRIHHGKHSGHSMYQYQPDDYISSDNMYPQNASMRTSDNLQNYDFSPPDEYVSGPKQQGYLATADHLDNDHRSMHLPSDSFARNGNQCHNFQLNAPHSHGVDRNSHQHGHPTHNHHNNHRQHRNRKEQEFDDDDDSDDSNPHLNAHCNRSDQFLPSNVYQQSMHDSQCSDNSQSPRFTFKAVDPPDAMHNQSVECDDTNKIHDLSERKANGQLQRLGSVSSLPTNLSVDSFQNYNPVPPEDIADITTDSQEIIDGLDQINKNNV